MGYCVETAVFRLFPTSSNLFNLGNSLQRQDFSILGHCIFAPRLRVWRPLPTSWPNRIRHTMHALISGGMPAVVGYDGTRCRPRLPLGASSKTSITAKLWRRVDWSPCRLTSPANLTLSNGRCTTFTSHAWRWVSLLLCFFCLKKRLSLMRALTPRTHWGRIFCLKSDLFRPCVTKFFINSFKVSVFKNSWSHCDEKNEIRSSSPL